MSEMKRGLVRMKTVALGLLASAALFTVLAESMRSRSPVWGYVAAFAEAALVGGIADWFAVVALFRHPLGLPIPHTAIIPSNKDRIGNNLATFICANFLSTAQVLQRLERIDIASRAALWLADPTHASQVAKHLSAALRYGLGAIDDERVRNFFRETVLKRLDDVDVSQLLGRLLDVLTSDGRHQHLLDGALQQLALMLDDASIKAEIAEVVASEVKYLRFVGLDNVAGRYATEKMVAGVIRLVGEMGAEPEHPLRVRFDGFIASFIARLKDDAEVRAKGDAIKRELLANPALGAYLQSLWSDMIAWLQEDLTRDDSAVREQLIAGTHTLGVKLVADQQMQGWINAQIRVAAPHWIDRYREDIRLYIVTRVGEWNAKEMTDELERNIGRDLQFIRINGTLVGGLVGLAIHTLTQWQRMAG